MRTLLVLSAVLLATSFAHASLTGYNCADDGDGAIVMNSTSFNPSGNEYILHMNGVQSWAPAHVLGDFIADSELDPTVLISEDVLNDTGFAWTGYEFYITMSKVFTISNPMKPASDWSYVINQPVAVGNSWKGSVIFSGGSPIEDGVTANLGLKVSFLGGISFSTEQIPTPEPATMAILGLGSMALLRRRKTA